LPKISNDQQHFAFNGYVLQGFWGPEIKEDSTPTKGFNDLDTLPSNPPLFRRVTQIWLYSSDSFFDSYVLRYERIDGWQTTIGNPPYPRAPDLKSTEMLLKDGEYINSVTVSKYMGSDLITSLLITTKLPDGSSRSLKSPELTSPKNREEVRTFTAPSGWQVVGFRGVAYDSKVSQASFIVLSIGLILALVPR
jgi:hypothetical protein